MEACEGWGASEARQVLAQLRVLKTSSVVVRVSEWFG